MQRERSIHQDLLSQVADSTRERDEVRRILGVENCSCPHELHDCASHENCRVVRRMNAASFKINATTVGVKDGSGDIRARIGLDEFERRLEEREAERKAIMADFNRRITDAELTKHNARRTAAVESAIDTRRQHPRTLRDAFPDPTWREGWQSAEAAAAEEEHIRAMFNDRPEPLGWRVANWTVGLALCALVLMALMGWLPGGAR